MKKMFIIQNQTTNVPMYIGEEGKEVSELAEALLYKTYADAENKIQEMAHQYAMKVSENRPYTNYYTTNYQDVLGNYKIVEVELSVRQQHSR